MIDEKTLKIRLLEKILRRMAILILKKYQPRIISITGSVGKTSTKEAIYTVLKNKFVVRKTEKNYNNEIGLPLTIIGVNSGENSIFKWIRVFLRWMWIILPGYKYPEVLILEMGADRLGDIKYLTSFIESNIGIITDFSASHVEFFKNVEGVAKEKSILVKKLSKEKLAIINMDNPYVAKLKNQLKARVVGFGFSEEAQMKATDINFNYAQESQSLKGLSFKLNYRGTTIPVRLNNILAKHQVYAVLAAVAVGAELGINLVEAGVALEKFLSPCGRMTLIEGIKNSFIIDDTYNASPVSVIAALDSLNEIVVSANKAEKIIVLGDMLELGSEEEEKHRLIGEKIGEMDCKYFMAVGERMRLAGEELAKSGFPKEKIFYFAGPIEAAKKAESLIGDGDYVLVKGSQGMRMEKIVEKIMQNPQLAEELLCRQNERWKEKEWKKV